jgi:hypothetical protein
MDSNLTPIDRYDERQEDALVRYAVWSRETNSALRSANVSDEDVWLLDAAIARRRFTRDCTLFVGTSRAAFESYVSHERFEYPAFLSTTDSLGSERRYYSREDPAQLIIQVRAGTPAAFLDDVSRASQSEREYVLGRGAHFQVLDVGEVSGPEVRKITGDPFHPRDTTLLRVELVLV